MLLVLITIAILALINQNTGKKCDTVKIYVDSKLVSSLPLDENAVREVCGGKNRIRIENGCAFMEYADCPDKLCIKQGKISDNSHDIVCLPNKVTVKVTRESDSDAVSR